MKTSLVAYLSLILQLFVAAICVGQESQTVPAEAYAFPADAELLPASVNAIQTESACCGSSLEQSTGSRGMTLKEMWNREHPDGTQHGHLRYWSTGIYYYHRPYSPSHYRQHRDRLLSSVRPYAPFKDETGFSRGYQYAPSSPSHLFRPLVRKADPVSDEVDMFDDSRVLEFADAVRYQHAKTVWDKKRQQENKNGTSARLSSHSK